MAEDPEEDPFAHTRMTLGEHLGELRTRLIRGLAAVAVAMLAAWIFRAPLIELATSPYDRAMDMLEEYRVEEAERILAENPERERTEFFVTADPNDKRLRSFQKKLIVIRPTENFVFVLKICLYAALIFGAPVLLWQMWQFIAAGLYVRERRAVRSYFPISVAAFGVGVVFGFLVVVPYGMYFLNRLVPMEVAEPNITAESFLTFLSSLCLAFGLVFQLPLVMTFLGRAGIVEPSSMARYRGHFIVCAFVLAAILTPPDPFTQLMMALPLGVLYEIGIWSAHVAARRHRPAVAEEAT